jgi:exodeoxyribonuclease VII small subunit
MANERSTKSAQQDQDAVEKPSYEAAREELIEVVRALEAGGTTLEESLALWERGEKLATICQEWLDGARKRLDAAMATDEE